MVPADGEAVAVASENENVEIGARERDSGGERKGSTVDKVNAVGVHEVGEAR